MTQTDDPATAWFGKPLFDDPAARALARVGVIDIGSNSVRMVVFDGAARSPAYFYNEKVMAGLGAGLTETGHLNPKGKDRARAALERFVMLARMMDVTPLVCVATAAMREATDGPAFRDSLQRDLGLKVHVIDGPEEARLSAQGVLLGWPGADGIVCDIGGSSMELAHLSGGEVGRRATSALGPLKLRDMGGAKAQAAHVKSELKALCAQVPKGADRLFLVGGSWRAFARIDMTRRGYPLSVLHEYRMTAGDVADTLKYLEKTDDPDSLRRAAGVSSTRMDLLPLAAQVLGPLIDAYAPRDIAVSSYGIREGVLFEQMPRPLRARDPLIEACRFAEAQSARLPGFGRILFDFVLPLFATADRDRLRLIKAACLLHDVNWRAHPDYRAEVCFDTATRANLSGIDHPGRIFLGLALLHRYRNGRVEDRFAAMLGLLDDEARRAAEVLGKAMRFGAMFSGLQADTMGRLDHDAQSGTLTLHLADRHRALFGEVAEQRFAALAKTLGADTALALDGSVTGR